MADQAKEVSVDQKVDEVEKLVKGLTLDERFTIARSIAEECVKDESLRTLLEKKPAFRAYDGFEPSGRMHIAQGVMKAINVNKLTSIGGTFVFWVADWFALLNNKMGGDLKKIKVVGQYMIEVWKASGMDMENVEFLWSSDEINSNSNEYWMQVMDIATRFSVTRVTRCSQIMGRGDDNLKAAQIMYPVMQCADIFHLKADICQLGMDQRKVNALALDYCDATKRRFKPVILSHHMLSGLKEGQEKMSKSDPGSAIFMEDTVGEVNKKIKQAYCPPEVIYHEKKEGEAENAIPRFKNPCFDYLKHLVFPKFGKCEITRKEENGGNKTYENYEEMEADYLSGALHPGDVKASLAKAINAMIAPVREHFETNQAAKNLLKRVKAFKVTK
eukprot:TRINITY_DN11179_c0_g1_i1.p1 TRINITY_DN11179_c0_g1~~TRINITY_DN11179_c0_g1_i1.p1  ORF type:complete len:387 (-),score=136.36 TRINITY_DN11179_c0_g1_i1:55-1215(-)